MLEEHIQQIEVQAQEKVGDEQRRNRELMQRLEREKALELENYAIKLQSAEREGASNQRDLTALRDEDAPGRRRLSLTIIACRRAAR